MGCNGDHYCGSHLQSVVTGIYDSLALSGVEKEAIVAKGLEGNSSWGKNCDAVADEAVKDQKLWPLSTRETFALNESIRQIWKGWIEG